jgi:conjugal transfer pilus assembly protein TraK
MRNRLVISLIFLAATASAAETEMVLQPDQVTPALVEKVINHSDHAGSGDDARNFFGYGATPQHSDTQPKPGTAKEAADSKKSPQQVYNEVPLPPTTPDDMSGGQVALPVITQKAIMSRSDDNWIICSEGAIKDIYTSDEKHVTKHYTGGSNALVKFQYLTDGTKIIYADPTPTEMHIPCGDAIYSIVAVPMGVPTQTIRLGSGKISKMRDNITMFRDDDTKKKITEIIRMAYNDDVPVSFETKYSNTPVNLFKDVSCTLHRTITVDGEGLVLKEFYLVPDIAGIEFTSESEFRRKEISENPLTIAAIGVLPLKPAKGERARLFVVEVKTMAQIDGGSDVR